MLHFSTTKYTPCSFSTCAISRGSLITFVYVLMIAPYIMLMCPTHFNLLDLMNLIHTILWIAIQIIELMFILMSPSTCNSLFLTPNHSSLHDTPQFNQTLNSIINAVSLPTGSLTACPTPAQQTAPHLSASPSVSSCRAHCDWMRIGNFTVP